MSNENQGTPPVAPNPLQQIGAGLRQLFGGLIQPAAQPSTGLPAPAPAEPETATLRYEQESKVINKKDYAEGVTIREAFEDYAETLGLDTSRDMTFRVGGAGVVDGNAGVEWGKTYTASVARSTKG